MNADDFSRSIRSLGSRYVQEYSRAMQSYTDLLNSASRTSGKGSGPAASDAQDLARRYADFVASQAPEVLSRLSEVSMSYYTALAELGMKTMSGYVDHVLRTGEATAARSAATSASRSTLLFHGVRGEEATNAFLIANHRDAAIDVAFEIAEVVSDDGQHRFSPRANFAPGHCRLAPHSERVVQCALAISDEFVAGKEYRGSISVAGLPDMAMPFCVQVEESVAAQPAAAAAKKNVTKRAKKATSGKKTPRKSAKKKASR